MEDYESVLRVILGESAEQWRGNPDITSYLAELSTYPIERFVKEPERLAEERTNILEQTQDLAFSNYKTFIQTAECSRGIYKDFKNVEAQLDGLSEQLPAFREECNKFNKVAQQLSAQRRLNSLTLAKHTHLLEVLELPQLMDTCVRRGYFQYALELAQHVRRMEKKHPQIPIVSSIVNEAQKSLQLMLSQLLSQLRSSVQLPQCLEVIGYIRQMGVFTEAELRVQFLQTRDAWFQGLLAAVPKDNAYQHITKTMELSRVHLFDIITQYRVIFRDEDPLLASSNLSIFTGWVLQKVEQFLVILEHDLSLGMGGRLDSVLGQCMYFGLSMSRVGADFRLLLQPIFFRVAQKSLKDGLEQAGLNFARNMQDYTLKSNNASQPPSSTAVLNDCLHPPMSLVEFPPVAEFCNELLTTLNDLRQFAPLGLASSVTIDLTELLKDAAKEILSLEERDSTADKATLDRLASSFAHDLVPYLDKILQTLFPPQQIATLLGIPLSQVLQEKLGCLDINDIIAELDHLLPEPQEIIVSVKEESKVLENERNAKDELSSTEKQLEDAMLTEVLPKETKQLEGRSGHIVLNEEGGKTENTPEVGVPETVVAADLFSNYSAETESPGDSFAIKLPIEDDFTGVSRFDHSSEENCVSSENSKSGHSSIAQSPREDDGSSLTSKSGNSSAVQSPRGNEGSFVTSKSGRSSAVQSPRDDEGSSVASKSGRSAAQSPRDDESSSVASKSGRSSAVQSPRDDEGSSVSSKSGRSSAVQSPRDDEGSSVSSKSGGSSAVQSPRDDEGSSVASKSGHSSAAQSPRNDEGSLVASKSGNSSNESTPRDS